MKAEIDEAPAKFWEDLSEYQRMTLQLTAAQMRTGSAFGTALIKYHQEFMQPFWIALDAFLSTEKEKLLSHPPADSMRDYFELLQFNLQVAEKGFRSGLEAMLGYHGNRASEGIQAWLNTILKRDGDTIVEFAEKEAL